MKPKKCKGHENDRMFKKGGIEPAVLKENAFALFARRKDKKRLFSADYRKRNGRT